MLVTQKNKMGTRNALPRGILSDSLLFLDSLDSPWFVYK
jgi:hypothetical protein